jgi:hypothetical protein
MTAKNFFKILTVGIVCIGYCIPPCMSGQEMISEDKILGDWEMEVDAGGEYFYLSFSLKKTDEGLKGTISESSGFFSSVPLQNIEFDGTILRFEMSIPTPPDGYENLVKTELEWIGGKFEGTLSVGSLGVSASATVTKKD